MNNNYIKKLFAKILSQTIYDFSNIWGIQHVAKQCTWSSNIDQSIIELIIN